MSSHLKGDSAGDVGLEGSLPPLIKSSGAAEADTANGTGAGERESQVSAQVESGGATLRQPRIRRKKN